MRGQTADGTAADSNVATLTAATTSDLRIAIVGATGAVGETALRLLADREHPPELLTLLASSRSKGKQIRYLNTELTVDEATPESFNGVNVAFISASSEVSRALAPEIVERGGLVIDDGSAFRMEPGVPLVVPEVNARDVEWHRGIISIPNCTTTPLVLTLHALRDLGELASVIVSTYQSVTGTGTAARAELLDQSREHLAGERHAPPTVYPRRIAFNLIPQVDDFADGGYTVEELKMLNESRKILHQPNLPLSATCVRVPVEVGHCESVSVQLDRNVSVEDARQAFADAAGIELVDDPAAGEYPTAIDAAGIDPVLVGRLRRDTARDNALTYWLASDNLRKGAALNALQILDECVARNSVRHRAPATTSLMPFA